MTILVVDDSIMVRKTMQKMLEKLGHTVLIATNGQESLDIYKKEKPDLVTMDLAMPVMSGMDALKHLIKMDPYVKVIISTANGFSDSVLLAMKEGASGYILKPITIDTLKDTISKIIINTIKEEVKNEDDFFKGIE